MRKLVDIVFVLMIVVVLLAISTVDNKANTDNGTQTYQQMLEQLVNSVNFAEIDYFLVTSTGYYPGPECCAPFDNGFTAMEVEAQKGIIAIDDRNGPFRMWDIIYVEGYGYGLCCDRGSAIKRWRVDLCFDTLQEAKEWEVRLVKSWKVGRMVDGDIKR